MSDRLPLSSLPIARYGWTIVIVLTWLAGLTIKLTKAADIGHLAEDLVGSYFMIWGLVLFLSKESREDLTKQCVMTTVTFAVALAALEGLTLVNLVDYRTVFSTPIYDPVCDPTHQLDPELLHAEPQTCSEVRPSRLFARRYSRK